ncbi:MAG: GIY-YIG nuclease family protein [bacterium]|nr:GIY-YIG nuclease family protein [bacterium]
MWYAYVLYSQSLDKFYIGSTGGLKQRLAEHRSNKVHTTSRMKKPELIYYEACVSKKDAMIREKQLKTGFGRGYLRKRLKCSIEITEIKYTDG